jgi:hypothetical protein
MPPELFEVSLEPKAMDKWVQKILDSLAASRSVMVAIGRTEFQTRISPVLLADRLAASVVGALQFVPVSAMCAEGGGTAAAVGKAMRWSRLEVVRQLAGGVVQLQPLAQNAPAFIVKVGSYDWPDAVWPR